MPPRRTSQTQYQHYIPRFLLRRFRENPDQAKTKKEKKKAYRKSRKTGISDETVLVYDITTGTLESKPIGKVYGEVNLYQDVKNIADVNYVEEKFSALEARAAEITNNLHASLKQGEFHMKRKSLEALRKFLFLTHYRSAARSHTYFKEDHPENKPLCDWIQKYKEAKGLDSHIEVWLDGLRYHLDTPHHVAVAEGEALQKKYNVSDFTEISMFTDSGANLENWHAFEYMSVSNMHFLGIWEAPDGSEFILGDNSFGLWEGLLCGAHMHRLYIISPRLGLVLRVGVAMIPVPKFAINSSLSDIPIEAATRHYANFTESDYNNVISRNIAMMKYRTTPQAQDDTFTFKFTKLTPSQTYFVNEVVMLNVRKNGAISFASKDNMLNMLCSYACSCDPHVLGDKSKFEPLVKTLLPAEVFPKSSSPQEPNLVPPTPPLSQATASSSSDSKDNDEEFLWLLMQGIVNKIVIFKTRYGQAYTVYHSAMKTPPLDNPVSESIGRMSSAASERMQSMLRPPPDDFIPRPDAKLAETLSARDSDFLMPVGAGFLDMLGIVGEDKLGEIIFDASIIGFLLWMARNRHDVLESLTEELDASLVL